MGFGVFLAVMLAALLHAGWNAIIKTGLDKPSAMLVMTLANAVLGGAVALALPLPAAGAWPWLMLSVAIHTAYQLFLGLAYEQGDLSRVYPIARGAAPVLVLGFSLLALDEALAWGELAGVLVLGGGIVLMARGVLTHGESRRLLPYALGAACATAGYTLSDGMGARASGAPVAYVAWLMLLLAFSYAPVVLALRGRRILTRDPRAWALGSVAAAASFGAYAIAVWAMTLAPIALVGALRETSILFAVLIGWLWFGERMDRGKALAALLIVGGVVLTRI